MARGEGIKPLSQLFEKYKNTLKPPQRSVVNAFCEVVYDLLEIQLNAEQIKYTPSTKTLTLNVPSVLKSEIQLHQEEIVHHLKGRLGAQNAPVRLL